MASDTTCFHSALVDLERAKEALWNAGFDYGSLSHLIIFHECATKWGNDDASLRALLLRIEDAVSKIALGVGDFCLRGQKAYNFESFDKDLRSIRPFKKEINEWYIKFSDCSSQSCSQDSDEVEEFIGSLLGTLDLLCHDNYNVYDCDSALVYRLDALKDNLIFLKNFIRFAKLREGIDHDIHLGQNLMTHIKAVAICAAHHCYMCWEDDAEDMVDDDEDDTDDHNDEDEDKDDTDDEDDTDDMVDEDGTDDHNDEDDRDDEDEDKDDTDDEDIDDKDDEDDTDDTGGEYCVAAR